ncbi:DegQ family serine endoprotease [Nevskia soli]|uniref:DegQ family serine endoprotease n=1 Tax=Nevskia soli TaxID=418856 RepID=UPI001B801915|nr:DegQ family serine endoprotease [Nevskia soli]
MATVATLALTTTSPAPVHADIPPAMLAPSAPGQVPSLAPMLKTVLPTVVNIAVSSKVQIQNPLLNDPFFRRFFNVPPGQQQPQEREEQAIGSGVIVDAAKGYVLTNNHVVEHADKIKVRLNDDRQFDAKLIGTDPQTDLAVLQIKADGLNALPLGDSAQLQVGDFVVAIGSPFNLRQTVTSGIVSGLGRNTGADDGSYQDFIQTDASINPGNSGGALINLRGELVGINSQIYSQSGGSIGIGFSIPVNLAKSVMSQLIATGKFERGRIGIVGQNLTPELVKALGLKENTHGALVAKVAPGTPADKAGLKDGDVVIQANGKTIKDMPELRNLIGLLKIGEKVDLTVLRDGATKQITVVVGKSPDEKVSAGGNDNGKDGGTAGGKGLNPKLKGATFGPVQDSDSKGVQVIELDRDSPAAEAGLQPGDIILSVNRHPVTGLADFQKLASGNGDLLLYVRRGDGALYLALQ